MIVFLIDYVQCYPLELKHRNSTKAVSSLGTFGKYPEA